MKNVYLFSNGCEQRALEASRIICYLECNNYRIVRKPNKANLIIFVTCAVVQNNIEFCLNKIKEFQKYDAELFIYGCLPVIAEERLNKIFKGKRLATKNLEKIDDFFPKNKINFSDIEENNHPFNNYKNKKPNMLLNKIRKKHLDYAYKKIFTENSIIYYQHIKQPYTICISRGCLGDCTYCATKKAIGTFKSKPLDDILKEFKKGLKTDYKSFLLVADDTGSYGLDINLTFPDLINELIKTPGDYEITIRSLRPIWLSKYIGEMEEIIKKDKIVAIGSPTQSGSKRILKLMHRYPDVERVINCFDRIKKVKPDILLDIHYILGFPTETWDEFIESLEFIKSINVSAGSIFPFSSIENTKADCIEPKVSKDEVKKRMKHSAKYLKKIGYDVSSKNKDIVIFSRKI